MRLTICRFTVICTLILSSLITVNGQSKDNKISELMNKQQMFKLNEKFNLYKNDLNPIIRYFAQAMLAESFNRPANGIAAVDSLLNNSAYQSQLGLRNIAYLIHLKSGFLESLYRYQESAAILSSFNSQTKAIDYDPNLKISLINTEKLHSSIAALPKTVFKYSNKKTKVPYKLKRAGKGTSYSIPCSINGIGIDMLIDTGNPKHTVIDRKRAAEFGIKAVIDSIPMFGVGSGYAQIGSADSINIGSMTFHNPLFYIVDNISPIDSIKIDVVLGSELLNTIGNITFNKKQSAVTFNVEDKTDKQLQPNMVMKNRHLFINLLCNNNNCLMHFDTGASHSNMSKFFFEKNKQYIIQKATTDSIRISGFGGISRHLGYRLPEIDFNLSNTDFSFKKIMIYTEPVMLHDKEDGCFGANLISRFNNLSINYRDMVITIEK
jgi:predicted aspartyl protease